MVILEVERLNVDFATRLDTTLEYKEGVGIESADVSCKSRLSVAADRGSSFGERPLLRYTTFLLLFGCFCRAVSSSKESCE